MTFAKAVTGYLGSFYHAEIGLFYLAKGVKEKNGMQSLNTKENANVGPILQDFKVNCLMTSPEAVLAAGSLVHRSREESLA